MAHQFKGDLDAAAADFTKVVEIGTTGEMANVDAMLEAAYYGLGAIALQQERADDAVEQLLKALAIKRTDADAMNLLGAAYVKAGTPEKAIEPLRRAVLFVPTGWPDPYQSLSAAYTAMGETDQAEWASAMVSGMAGDPAGAITRLEAIADGDAKLDAQIGLGLLNEINGDGSAAADWYRKALALDSTSQPAQLGLGRVTEGTQAHPSIEPSPSVEGNN
jgi:tetratricopeptide (TPR) repeat protein